MKSSAWVAKVSPRSGSDGFLVSIILPFTTFGSCEIILTRLFAYIFTHHPTALAVSFAVFGLGGTARVLSRACASE
jgi:hypothetical protein